MSPVLIQGLDRGHMVSLLMEVLILGSHAHDVVTDTSMSNQSELLRDFILNIKEMEACCQSVAIFGKHVKLKSHSIVPSFWCWHIQHVAHLL